MRFASSVAALSLAALASPSFGGDRAAAEDSGFNGKIAFSAKDSVPAWPAPVQAPKGAPNLVLILLDDVGFGDTSPFGGPARMPALERLAAEGLRYNQFHTAGICSPTRAALLSGRNHHRMGFGEFGGVGYPGYDGIWKKSTASIAEVLKRNGYSTAAFGKWHNTPSWEIGPEGPFERWPTGLGFNYFYGFMRGGVSQWEPRLYRNTTATQLPRAAGEPVHLTTNLVDEAIDWLHTHESSAPDKPYFLYMASGAAHAPHHVPKACIEKYRGQFDRGWDRLRRETFARQKKLGVVPGNAKLTQRPRELPAWSSFSADEQRLLARQMEVFAGFLSHTDHELGRLIAAARQGPAGDNTLILYIVGDNGDEGSVSLTGTVNVIGDLLSEPGTVEEQLAHLDELGSREFDNDYASGWAWAGTTPFKWMKFVASHFGATRNPMVVSWPARIKDHGGIRSQFTHVNDVAATLYEAAGVRAPEELDGIRQEPLDGVSFVYSFDDATAPARHQVQYFEIGGNRAIYADGWVAAARHSVPWTMRRHPDSDYEHDRWELYHVAEDFTQQHDLAARFPDKLRELKTTFDAEARRNQVYPLGAGFGSGPPEPGPPARQFVYYDGFSGDARQFDFSASHRITAQVIVPANGAEGVIAAAGDRRSGFALYVVDGRLVYENNHFGKRRDIVRSRKILPTGRLELAYEFTSGKPSGSAGGDARLFVNGCLAGEVHLAHGPVALTGMQIGHNSPAPITSAYEAPFRFTGEIEKVTLQMK